MILSNLHIKEMAIELAKKFSIIDFDATNRWLAKFKTRHSLSVKTISGVAFLVNNDLISGFKYKYLNKLKEYKPKDIFNCDETGLFWSEMPKKTIKVGKKDIACGKFYKERITILFCVNLAGEKLWPLVIEKSKKQGL
ncbi:Tigger transposable element-derived protein 6 [Dictyocoela muelleri]|nr:Tigger transposable element-derived protein 6 [Dictyocoela muelleri]